MVKRRRSSPAAALAFVVVAGLCGGCLAGFLGIQDGYFVDRSTSESIYLHGMVYQTSISDIVGEWQTPLQMEVDVRQMMMSNVNSIRVDFVWKSIEYEDNKFNWNNTDQLISVCKRYGIRLFPIIGYQWPPEWVEGSVYMESPTINTVPDYGVYTMSPPGPGPALIQPLQTFRQRWVSEEISLENTQARAQFKEYLQAVVSRYSNEETIGGWIIGNQMGYIGGLTQRQQGYDPPSEEAFRLHLQRRFGGAISALNARWGSTFGSFTTVRMPESYDRESVRWADLIAWREDSLAGFVRDAAVTVKQFDPNHVIGYATRAVPLGPEDWRYNAEDLKKIADECASANAKLDFIGLNIYPNMTTGSELRSTRWAFERVRWQTGLPIMATEIGVSSTDPALAKTSDPQAIQGLYLRSAVWEAVLTGAIGVHVFNFNDRVWFPLAERGFGLVTSDRFSKTSLSAVTSVFDSIDDLATECPTRREFCSLLPKSTRNPRPEIVFLWTSAADQMIGRYMSQTAGMFGALTRLGFDCTFADASQLTTRLGSNTQRPKAVVLPRNRRMAVGELQQIVDRARANGVPIFADGDLPGRQTDPTATGLNSGIKPQTDFNDLMESVFGITPVTPDAFTDTAAAADYVTDHASNVTFASGIIYGQNLAPSCVKTWQYSRVATNASNTNVTVLATLQLSGDVSQVSICPGIARGNDSIPAVVVKNYPGTTFKAAIAPFGFGGIATGGLESLRAHFDWYNVVFRSSAGFNLSPGIRVTGSAREYVSVDYRRLVNGDYLIFVMFWQDVYLSSQVQRLTISMDVLAAADHLINVVSLQRVFLTQDTGGGSKFFTVQVDPLTTLVLRSRASSIVSPTIQVRSQPLDDGRLQYPTAVMPNGQAFSYQMTLDYALPTSFAGTPETYNLVGEIVYGSVLNPTVIWASTEQVSISGALGAVTLPIQIPDPNLAGPYGVNSTYLGGTFFVRSRIIRRSDNVTRATSKGRAISVDWGVWPLSYPRYGKTDEVAQRPAVGRALANLPGAVNPNPIGYQPAQRRKLKQVSDNAKEVITMGWNWMLPDQMRRDANPYRVLVYNSTKTAAIYSGHAFAVYNLAEHMDAAGYERLSDFSFKAEYELISQGKRVYYILDDNWATDLGVRYNLDASALATFFKILIFPNVYIMNEAEANNLYQFATTTFNARIISTSSCLGCMLPDGTRNDRLAAILGFEENSYVENNGRAPSRTVVPDYDGIGSRILRTLENKQSYSLLHTINNNPKAYRADIPLYTRPNAVENGVRPQVLAVFADTVVPAMVTNVFGTSAAAVTFNYDACSEPVGSPTDYIWRDVLSWAQQAGVPFQRFRFSVQCPPIPPIKPFKVYENAYAEIWVDVGRGNQTFTTTPTSVACEEPVFFAFTYVSELASDVIDLYDVRFTTYSSANDSAWYLLPLGPSNRKKQDPYYIVWAVTAGAAAFISITVRLIVYCATKL